MTTEICYLISSDPSPNISHFLVGTIGTCDDDLLAVTLDGVAYGDRPADHDQSSQGCMPLHGVKFDVPVMTDIPVQVCLLYDGLLAYQADAVWVQVKAGTECVSDVVGGVTCDPAMSCP